MVSEYVVETRLAKLNKKLMLKNLPWHCIYIPATVPVIKAILAAHPSITSQSQSHSHTDSGLNLEIITVAAVTYIIQQDSYTVNVPKLKKKA